MPPKPKRPSSPSSASPHPFNPQTLPTPSLTDPSIKKSYRIGRGEQGVLTFEPYKSLLLPHWRFRTPAIAETSSSNLKAAFDHFVSKNDFVGADMARKFIQMGMTRARRYANFKGGRKYERVKAEEGEGGEEGETKGGGKVEKEKSAGHEGREEKVRASEIFKAVWRRCIVDEAYLELKRGFMEDRKRWDREEKKKAKAEEVKEEDDDDDKEEDE